MGSLFEEALHILRRVSEEQTNLMGKFLTLADSVLQMHNAAPEVIHRIAPLLEQSPCGGIIHIPLQMIRSIEVNERRTFTNRKDHDSNSLSSELAIQLSYLRIEPFPAPERTAE